jgi:hypothetical protein
MKHKLQLFFFGGDSLIIRAILLDNDLDWELLRSHFYHCRNLFCDRCWFVERYRLCGQSKDILGDRS